MTSTLQQQDGLQHSHQGDLELVGVTKRFGDFVAVDDLSLTVPQGSFFALLGASGCGKTTTLRMVAGLETPTSGRIELGDRDISSLKPYKRPVNTVFQSYALFPHMSIEDNVAFGLKRTGASDVAAKVTEMLELVQLEQYAKRRPAQLSGGQQQRVALARALINRPQVLLLDEPLGALDLKLRRSMQLELKRIQTEVGITFVHVTHDQEEAMTMADTIAVMSSGRIEQLGAPAELYEHPTSTFVANFLGQSNLLEGDVVRGGGDDYAVGVHGTELHATKVAAGVEGRCWIGVRPEKVTLETPGENHVEGLNRLGGGRVADVSFVGVSTQYLIRMPWGQELSAFEQNTGKRVSFAAGDPVDLTWMSEHTFLLDHDQDATAGSQIDDE